MLQVINSLGGGDTHIPVLTVTTVSALETAEIVDTAQTVATVVMAETGETVVTAETVKTGEMYS